MQHSFYKIWSPFAFFKNFPLLVESFFLCGQPIPPGPNEYHVMGKANWRSSSSFTEMLLWESSLLWEVLFSGRTSRWPLFLVQLRLIRRPRRANRRFQALKQCKENIFELFTKAQVSKDIISQELKIGLEIDEIPGTRKEPDLLYEVNYFYCTTRLGFCESAAHRHE